MKKTIDRRVCMLKESLEQRNNEAKSSNNKNKHRHNY